LLPNPVLVPKAPPVPDPKDPPPNPLVAGLAPNKPPPVAPPDAPKALVVLVVAPNPPVDPKADGVLAFCCGCPKADVVLDPNRPFVNPDLNDVPVFAGL
jgi:hypothetical protein